MQELVSEGKYHQRWYFSSLITDESQLDSILSTMNRAAAFLSGVELNLFLDSSERDEYLKFTPMGSGQKRKKRDPKALFECKFQCQLRDKAQDEEKEKRR
jgi:hypothetical protein